MRLEFARPWVQFLAGLRCVFSSDPAVSSSTFVGTERKENLIRNDPDKSEFTKPVLIPTPIWHACSYSLALSSALDIFLLSCLATFVLSMSEVD